MDNNPTDNSVKAPYDPGWNDPPKLSYNSQQITPNRPRNFLNKRVAFPLSGSSPNATIPPVNLLPMPAATIAPVVNNSYYLPPAPAENNLDSDKALVEVKEILLQFLNDSSELGSKASDIKRRIGVMEDMWKSGKFNEKVQSLMLELSYALRGDNPSKADDLHRALMVDHVSVVGMWMPGIKQLIHHCVARSELLAIDKES